MDNTKEYFITLLARERGLILEGKVSQYVLDSLLEVASDSLQTALFEGVDEIPFEWNRNIES